jgi:hypothetical protein
MRTVLIGVALGTILLSLSEGKSFARSDMTFKGAYAAPGLPTRAILAPYYQNRHVYTASEIDALIKRPESVLDLLRNMKTAWDQKLLVQQAFWRNAALLRFLGAERLEWRPLDPFGRIPPVFDPKRQLTKDIGTMSVHSRLLPVPIEASRIHFTSPAETASWIYGYPMHAESNGGIRFNVPQGELRWQAVRELLGSHYINRGPPPPPVASKSPNQSAAENELYKVSNRFYESPLDPSSDFSVCYESPEGTPKKLYDPSDGVSDAICFGLKLGSDSLLFHGGPPKPMRGPADDDIVVFVNMVQHYGHIPPGCYGLKLDPSLIGWCPVRDH